MTEPKKRPGRTRKISVSLGEADLRTLERLAKKRHRGNVSAALAEGIHRLDEERGRRELLDWLAAAAEMTAHERGVILKEWAGVADRRPHRRSGSGRSAA